MLVQSLLHNLPFASGLTYLMIALSASFNCWAVNLVPSVLRRIPYVPNCKVEPLIDPPVLTGTLPFCFFCTSLNRGAYSCLKRTRVRGIPLALLAKRPSFRLSRAIMLVRNLCDFQIVSPSAFSQDSVKASFKRFSSLQKSRIVVHFVKGDILVRDDR